LLALKNGEHSMAQTLEQTSIDLDAYFQRIGYDGQRAPTLATLQAIHARHAATIPFENLTPLLHQPVRLDLASLQEKLVHAGRGGYCFEQNLLLRAALLTLGYQVRGLAARVRWNVPDEVVTARGHMLLRVEIDGQTYLADVGFGGLTLTAPLALIPDLVQPTPHEPFRIASDGDGYLMQAQIDRSWKSLYRFDLQEQYLPDYEVSSWYLSNNPSSHFVTGLMAARPDVDRRYALRNNQLAIHHLNGATERRTLTAVGELRTALAEVFQISLPETPDLDPALQRLVEQA
jgi:N-hydroxyarylamine O-acetyltransferase